MDRKEKIMQSALTLFAIKTYHGTSISHIAKEASVSKSLIYNYFESKEDLLNAVIVKEFVGAFNLYDIDFENISDESLSSFVDQTFDLLDANPQFWKLLFSLMLQDGVMETVAPEILKNLEPFMQGLIKYFAMKGYADPIGETQFFWALMDGLSIDYIMMQIDRKYCSNRVKRIYKLK